jgi:hypothetical protein
MLEVLHDKQLRETLKTRGYEYSQQNSWDRKKQQYLDLIDSLSTERFENPEPIENGAHDAMQELAGSAAVRQRLETVRVSSDRQPVRKAD